jgi:hypothetical protein
MFAVGGERCPVFLFKQLICRPQNDLKNMQNDGLFYLSINANRRAEDYIWFKAQPVGVNKINDMIWNIIADTSLENSDKKFNDHSGRKTVVSKLKKANVERSSVSSPFWLFCK